MAVNYDRSANVLQQAFAAAEASLLRLDRSPTVTPEIDAALDLLFSSKTQAYREVLLGCLLAKIDNAEVDISKAYVNLGEAAYNGRTLDERVVNPFLHEHRIPSSKGPFLAVFRRSVSFKASTRQGTRDKAGFDAFLKLVERVQRSKEGPNRSLLSAILHRFALLREQSSIAISKLNRASLAQYNAIVDALLKIPSGGRLPMLLIISVLAGIKQHFQLDWQIDSQGINEADAAKGASADITVSSQGSIVLSAEVTERNIDKARIISTFNSKISPAGLEDYLFFINEPSADEDARIQASKYFAQGSEVNFVDIRTWTSMSLVTMGRTGRSAFNQKLTESISKNDVPKSVKLSWNRIIAEVISA